MNAVRAHWEKLAVELKQAVDNFITHNPSSLLDTLSCGRSEKDTFTLSRRVSNPHKLREARYPHKLLEARSYDLKCDFTQGPNEAVGHLKVRSSIRRQADLELIRETAKAYEIHPDTDRPFHGKAGLLTTEQVVDEILCPLLKI